MEWISVNDMQPIVGELINFTDGKTIYIGRYGRDRRGKYIFEKHGDPRPRPNITHWMLLSMPGKESNKPVLVERDIFREMSNIGIEFIEVKKTWQATMLNFNSMRTSFDHQETYSKQLIEEIKLTNKNIRTHSISQLKDMVTLSFRHLEAMIHELKLDISELRRDSK